MKSRLCIDYYTPFAWTPAPPAAARTQGPRGCGEARLSRFSLRLGQLTSSPLCSAACRRIEPLYPGPGSTPRASFCPGGAEAVVAYAPEKLACHVMSNTANRAPLLTFDALAIPISIPLHWLFQYDVSISSPRHFLPCPPLVLEGPVFSICCARVGHIWPEKLPLVYQVPIHEGGHQASSRHTSRQKGTSGDFGTLYRGQGRRGATC